MYLHIEFALPLIIHNGLCQHLLTIRTPTYCENEMNLNFYSTIAHYKIANVHNSNYSLFHIVHTEDTILEHAIDKQREPTINTAILFTRRPNQSIVKVYICAF